MALRILLGLAIVLITTGAALYSFPAGLIVLGVLVAGFGFLEFTDVP